MSMFIQRRNSTILKYGQDFLFLAIVFFLLGLTPGRAQAMVPVPPPAPQLTAPADRGNLTTLTPLLRWTAVSGANAYFLQVSSVPDFTTVILENVSSSTSYQVQNSDGLVYGTTYYWDVGVISANNTWGSLSAVRQFTLTDQLSPSDGAYFTSQSPKFSWAAVKGAIHYDFWLKDSPTINYLPSCIGFPHPICNFPTSSGTSTSYQASSLAYGAHY